MNCPAQAYNLTRNRTGGESVVLIEEEPVMVRTLRTALLVGSVALSAAGLALAPTAAQARVHVGIGIGVPLFGPGYYAAPYPYYAPYYPAPYPAPPAYYAAPPAYYAPPPAYYAPPPAGAAPAAVAPSSSTCREYSSTQIIGGSPQQVFGIACQQPDGSWRIVD
jgi:hypothetical protein